MATPILKMRGITKRFPGVLANDKVDLTLYPGEIHALLGENGAGKSTLMNVLTGIYYPNEGKIYYKGELVKVHSTKAAAELGIGMVHQHFKLIDTLSVAENVFLVSKRCRFLLKKEKINRQVERCAKEYNLNLDPSARVWQLSIGEQQRVEIVKLLFCRAEILILDEPTAVLTPQESKDLFTALRRMADSGKTVMFITHKMNEVMRYADRITVLRDGRSIASMLRAETSAEDLTTRMVGRPLSPAAGKTEKTGGGKIALSLENVCAKGDKGVNALTNVTLHINSGEILGVAGVAGNGQRELAEVITGLRPATSGVIRMGAGEITNRTPKQILRTGVASIPEDRIGTGLVSSMNLYENAILRDYDQPPCSQMGLLNYTAIKRRAETFAAKHRIKNAGLTKPVGLMSGGNLQKLLIAREINGEPGVIIAAYPVHGLDIGATAAIHDILIAQRNRGAAILLISEDLDELFELSDRITALNEGRIMGVYDVAEADYEKIGRMMLGTARSEVTV